MSLPKNYFNRATITFTSGDNATFSRQIKVANINADGTVTIVLYEELPEDPVVGDVLSLPPGCDRSYSTCRNNFNNVLNRRAYGDLIPGLDAIIKGPL
jgi:hypothetical protein